MTFDRKAIMQRAWEIKRQNKANIFGDGNEHETSCKSMVAIRMAALLGIEEAEIMNAAYARYGAEIAKVEENGGAIEYDEDDFESPEDYAMYVMLGDESGLKK